MRLRYVALGLVVFACGLLHASAIWSTVGYVTVEPGKSHFTWAMGIDPEGSTWLPIYVFDPKDQTPGRWVTVRSEPGSTEFSVSDNFSVSPEANHRPVHFLATPESQIFVTGVVATDKKPSQWIVRTISKGEASWKTLFQQSDFGIYSGSGFSTAVHKGRVLTGGRAKFDESETTQRAALLSMNLDGSEKKILFKSQDPDYPKSAVLCVQTFQNQLLMVTSLTNKNDQTSTVIWASQDDGGTWEQRGSLVYSGIETPWIDVNACDFDSKGNYYITARLSHPNGSKNSGAVLYPSSDFGKTIQMIDAFVPPKAQNVQPRRALVDREGNIFYPIHGSWEDGKLGYAVRGSFDGGRTFFTADAYELDNPEFNTGAAVLALDVDGSILMSGYETNSEGQRILLRRSL